MLETLTKGFRSARLKLQGKAMLGEENLSEALREVRLSLLEADVELGVVKTFLDQVREKALGEVVQLKVKGPGGMEVTPADHFIKICHDTLVDLMGAEEGALDLGQHPAIVMLVGLQGSGKTTTAGKLARYCLRDGRKPMLVAADIYRPAAVDQLVTIGRKLSVPVFYIKGLKPVQLCELALVQAKNVGRDLVIFDTAGRLAIDNELMDELVQIRQRTRPANVLFVCDAMIGQDAVRTAAEFDRKLDFSGFILTKMDGDARGGAALSIRQVTGKPVRFVGTGEGFDKIEPFRAEGLAGRILGFGDVVGLMRDFEEVVDQKTVEKDAMKMLSGDFTFDGFLGQLRMIKKIGSLKDIVGKMPLFSGMMDQLPKEALDDRELVKVESMIQSMTTQERGRPEVFNESRIRRIARGSGRNPADVRELYERFQMARYAMKQVGAASGLFGSMKQARRARSLLGGMGGMGGMGDGGEGFPGGFPTGLPGEGDGASQPRLSYDEKLARKKKQKDERRARRKNQKRR
jgi:signal recognition particle subunit SRP54